MAKYINKAELWNNRAEWRNPKQIDKKEYNNGWNDCNDGWLNIITEIPTIEIVHCSECIHAKLNRADGEYYCDILQYDFAKDYYCADGEREE